MKECVRECDACISHDIVEVSDLNDFLGCVVGVCRFDVKDYVTGFGNSTWKSTHKAAEKTAVVVTALLMSGATCVGKTVVDEFSFG